MFSVPDSWLSCNKDTVGELDGEDGLKHSTHTKTIRFRVRGIECTEYKCTPMQGIVFVCVFTISCVCMWIYLCILYLLCILVCADCRHVCACVLSVEC